MIHPFLTFLLYIFTILSITYSQLILSHPTESKSCIYLYFISLLISSLTALSIYNRLWALPMPKVNQSTSKTYNPEAITETNLLTQDGWNTLTHNTFQRTEVQQR
jgi:hypothetical protein